MEIQTIAISRWHCPTLSAAHQAVVACGWRDRSTSFVALKCGLFLLSSHIPNPAAVSDPLPASQGGPELPAGPSVSRSICAGRGVVPCNLQPATLQPATCNSIQGSCAFEYAPFPFRGEMISSMACWLDPMVLSRHSALIVSSLHWGDSMGLPLWACFRAPALRPTAPMAAVA